MSHDDNKTEKKKKRTWNKIDSKDKTVVNVSLQKSNLELLRTIMGEWEEKGLIISNEICECMIFKHDFENNPYLQRLVATLNLIRTTLKTKNLFGKDESDALAIAIKNILDIKVIPIELGRFLEDENYFNDTIYEDKNMTNTSKSTISYEELALETNQETSLEIDTYSNNIVSTNPTISNTDNNTNDKIKNTIVCCNNKINSNTSCSSDNIITSVEDKTNFTATDNSTESNPKDEIIVWDKFPKELPSSNDNTQAKVLNDKLSGFIFKS